MKQPNGYCFLEVKKYRLQSVTGYHGLPEAKFKFISFGKEWGSPKILPGRLRIRSVRGISYGRS